MPNTTSSIPKLRVPKAAAAAIVLTPPAWSLPVGLGTGLVGFSYLLWRLGGGGSGLGMLPYALALATAAVYLLPRSWDRVELKDNKVLLVRRNRVKLCAVVKNFRDVRLGFFTKRLRFADGKEISIPLVWAESERIISFFHRRVDELAQGNLEEQLQQRASRARLPSSLRRAG